MTDLDLTVQHVLDHAKTIVIKVGSLLVRGQELDQVNQEWMDALAADIKPLIEKGKRVIIVSSGGIALGRKALGICPSLPPSEIPLAQKQAASAVGQYHVFDGYFKAFSKQKICAAQVLLTMSETESWRMSLNARETLKTLLNQGIVPVINENDVVSTKEIRFGDNDRLAVRVAQMIMADVVVLLSTAGGLYTANPDVNPQAEHIPRVTELSSQHKEMAGDALAGLSTGGMKSKITAAENAMKSGIHLIITNGRENHAFGALCSDLTRLSTLFLAQECAESARKSWLRSHLSPKGAVIIDDGALSALKGGKSLLPIGVKKVEGDFHRGDAVIIKTEDGQKIGMGISAYNTLHASQIIGKPSGEISKTLGFSGRNALIHRNDMILAL